MPGCKEHCGDLLGGCRSLFGACRSIFGASWSEPLLLASSVKIKALLHDRKTPKTTSKEAPGVQTPFIRTRRGEIDRGASFWHVYRKMKMSGRKRVPESGEILRNPCLATFGNVWQCLAKFGKVWQSLAILGNLWTVLSKHFYLKKAVPLHEQKRPKTARSTAI